MLLTDCGSLRGIWSANYFIGKISIFHQYFSKIYSAHLQRFNNFVFLAFLSAFIRFVKQVFEKFSKSHNVYIIESPPFDVWH